MADRRIGCLPVLDGNKLVGIVTATDLLAVLADSGSTGAELTAPGGEDPETSG